MSDNENLPDGYHVAPDGTVWALPGAMGAEGWENWDKLLQGRVPVTNTNGPIGRDVAVKVRRKPVPMATVPADVLERLVEDSMRAPYRSTWASDRDLACDAIANARSEQA